MSKCKTFAHSNKKYEQTWRKVAFTLTQYFASGIITPGTRGKTSDESTPWQCESIKAADDCNLAVSCALWRFDCPVSWSCASTVWKESGIILNLCSRDRNGGLDNKKNMFNTGDTIGIIITNMSKDLRLFSTRYTTRIRQIITFDCAICSSIPPVCHAGKNLISSRIVTGPTADSSYWTKGGWAGINTICRCWASAIYATEWSHN